MTERIAPHEGIKERPQNIESDITDIKERIDALFAWQLTEGEYHEIIPPTPPSVPKDFVHDTTINATDIIYSLGEDEKGQERKVTITKGVTSRNGSNGISEDPEDITIDADHLPVVYRFTSKGARVESRLYVSDPPPLKAREFGVFESERYYLGFERSPLFRVPLWESDIQKVNALLDEVGIPGEDNSSVKIIETHRNKITAWGQKNQ